MAPSEDGRSARLVDGFRQRLEEAGCRVVVAPDPVSAAAALDLAHDPAEVAYAPSPLVDAVLRDVEGWVRAPRADRAFVGLVEADLGVADTGTLAFSSPDPQLRMASTLPPAVVALVRCDRIVPRLEDVIERLQGPVLTFMTGPSTTGDIEGISVTGVHGPAEMTVVIVGGDGP